MMHFASRKKGLSKKAFELAYKGYRFLVAKGKLSNTRYLTICDMGQSSRRKRLYVIDMVANQLALNTWVAHGRNSGVEYATRFSNKMSSRQSSLGFYITMNTYNGNHGLSLRMKVLNRVLMIKPMQERWSYMVLIISVGNRLIKIW